VKDPTRFEFFRVPVEKLKEVVQKLQDAFRNPNKPGNKEFIELHRVNPEALWQKQSQTSYNSIDDSRVDWSQLKRVGVSREGPGLHPSHLNKLSPK
jgi:hypothetical protein